jgi:hypothetical protein
MRRFTGSKNVHVGREQRRLQLVQLACTASTQSACCQESGLVDLVLSGVTLQAWRTVHINHTYMEWLQI